ncbi:tetraprenyl-beta-curcumene synthase family protein [Aquibacillus sp. 3ASR75-54]|uniref:Tetraprenyl-beta-curcumene synthase family protein n=2 Tax=Aquibacillus salsiterrae TaxID=2950439 RepID=A0A9X4AG35_9BACI|nr:tetraprenyl-beta-curcumene synthase family protein [Aquibacillus salsiterrae]
MRFVYQHVFPEVDKEINYWKQRATQIPDKDLREQALASISSKKFHCQGGAVYSILAKSNWQTALRFIVAYQTISDYLDNLCDRSTSLDPEDFRMLHYSMEDALSPNNPTRNYYCYRDEQEDGDYLKDLVLTCQSTLSAITYYPQIKDYLLKLEQLYSDLQVHKHVKEDEREKRLETWFNTYKQGFPNLTWYEFSACSGSTLGIFCIVSYALEQDVEKTFVDEIFKSYFPYMQGLHILLDYYIDQKEDIEEGDLNFCTYYKNKDHMKKRLLYFMEQTKLHVKNLPNKQFHEMVHSGLVGLYLADNKVKEITGNKEVTRALLKKGGLRSFFFHLNVKLYNRLKKG